MSKMRAMQVSRPGGPFEMVERDVPEPGAGEIRIKVQACGICHSDSLTKEGHLPGIEYPRVPGHEVVGIIDAVGPGVAGWAPGQRVGVGWNGGYCGYCDHCRRGDFFACQTATTSPASPATAATRDYMVARARGGGARARRIVRRGGRAADVRRDHHVQLLCATAAHGRAKSSRCSAWAASATSASSTPRKWASTRSASHAGRTRSRSPASSARGDTSTARSQDPAAELQKLGGAKVILATVTSGDAMAAVQGGLAVNGTLLIVGRRSRCPFLRCNCSWDASRSRAGIRALRSIRRTRSPSACRPACGP